MKAFFTILTLCCIALCSAQDFQSIITTHLQNNLKSTQLSAVDVQNIKIISQSYSKSLKAHTVYAIQQFNNKPVIHSVSVFVIRDNEVISKNLSFASQIQSKMSTANAVLTPLQALQNAAQFANLPIGNIEIAKSADKSIAAFTSKTLSLYEIPVTLSYLKDNNSYKMVYEIPLYYPNGDHYYFIYIDALNGQVVKSQDFVLSCNFGHDHSDNKQNSTVKIKETHRFGTSTAMFNDGSVYNVFPFPVESPLHGNAATVTNPANTLASPFGWHDINGLTGAEFTITRGNNVYAQDDLDGNNITFGRSPNGGSTLNFNIPQNINNNPISNIDASTVNLFYVNNIMHDVWYQYGFDEASGNFQVNNYERGGTSGDHVVADVLDGSGINNATFGTPPDGGSPRMNMFLWENSDPDDRPITILDTRFAGSYSAGSAGFGNKIPSAGPPVNGTLALAVDSPATADPNDACETLTNPATLNGKIVLIRRGSCEFSFKVLAAQNAGAIAVLIVNNVPGNPTAMASGAVGDQVTIPSYMIEQGVGDFLISQINAGVVINASLAGINLIRKDGSLDNVIVAHEYGHGISTRLTGGRNTSNCLGNEEQMGEGWSDWFGLMLSIKPGDTGAKPRGIGNYATNQTTVSRGIRNFPYSTDFNINPVTYANTNSTNFSVPHGVGSVWASILWDLTWRFIADFGFDPNLYSGTGGNNKVMQLVVDGLKLQPCNPGFVDGRNAILQADMIANNGANQRRIYEVFAARGVGASASQGTAESRFDQTEAYDIPTTLSNRDVALNTAVIYPNPSNGSFTIKGVAEPGNSTVTIYDLNGRTVFNTSLILSGSNNIETAGLDQGIYIVTIKTETSNQSLKLIIN